jgi:histidinol-phosphate aminotransferase
MSYFMKKLTTKGIESLIPYPPGKPIEELERELGISGSIKLASNENPLGPSPMAVAAIVNNVNKINRYPDGSAYYLKSRLAELYGLPLNRIMIGNGSNELLELIIRSFLTNGEEVIQGFPTFLFYEKVVTGAGGKLISVPLKDFKINLDGILNAVTGDTKIIFINNPNNPTGSVLSMKEIIDFLKALPEDVVTVLDEAYIDFVTDKDAADGFKILDDYPRLILLRTFSKLYGLAGLRIGYGFSSIEIVDYINRVRQPFNVNLLAQVAAAAALDDKGFVLKTLRVVKEGLKYLFTKLDELGIEYRPTQTNFFLIKSPLGGKKTYERMLKEGVIIRSMESFGLKDYIRINVGLAEENERFIKTFKKVLAENSAS